MQSKILILGAGQGQVPLVKFAKENNYFVIVVSPEGDYPAFKYADKCIYLNILDKVGVLNVAKEENINAIATDQTDISVGVVEYVAEKLNLSHVKCKSIENFRDKSLMRDICKQHGIKTIPYCVIDNLDEAILFWKGNNNFKVIIKPIDSQGSRGVETATTLQEIECAFNNAYKYSFSKKIIIEQFIEGEEIEVDTVVNNGNIIATLIGDVYNFTSENCFSAYERIYPTTKSEEIKQKINLVNQQTLKALGVVIGWTHGEYIVTSDGDVYLLEVGLRGGGNYIGSDIIKEMLGVGTHEMAFYTAIGNDSFYDKVSLRNYTCAYKCFYLPEGEILTVNIDKTFFEQDCIVRHNLDIIENIKYTSKNTDKTSRFTIVVRGANQLDLKTLLDEIPNHIDIKIKTNKGIEHIIWK
jgi:carbamoyl-phosphate synthase large subunit